IQRANFKILADPNGGSSIIVLEKLFKKLGVNAKIVNNEPGKFVRLVEPNTESLAYLSDMMKGSDFEFACGFDCDADRSELVLPPGSELEKEMGVVVSGQYVLSLVCDSYLEGKNDQIVVTNDCTSGLLKRVLDKYKVNLIEVEVGEMNVVEEMEKQNSIIGGEGSNGGTIIFPIKCRDGIMSIVLILKMLAEKNKSLVDILENYPKYYSNRVKLSCSPNQVANLKTKLEEFFVNENYKIQKTGDITGGLKIIFDEDSYLWFRPSKTEAGAFRIISDSNDQNKVKEILEKGIKLFNKFKN
ncbi:hypothetical protein K8R66_00440, partial [bacterium]|nr:hypothetical protein [bacterium]